MKFRYRLCTFILFGAVALRGDDVTKWNLVATNAALAAGQSPPLQTRTYAIVHVAIHDALKKLPHYASEYPDLELPATQEEVLRAAWPSQFRHWEAGK